MLYIDVDLQQFKLLTQETSSYKTNLYRKGSNLEKSRRDSKLFISLYGFKNFKTYTYE